MTRAGALASRGPKSVAERLLQLGRRLGRDCGKLRFGNPVTHVYNPLVYAAKPYGEYLERYGGGPKKTLFLGMNPGPFGMAQTGIPFGEVEAVRDWLRIGGDVGKPAQECPKRPVLGFGCTRSEVSGRRLWGLFRKRFADPENFFSENLVLNYCPLLFLSALNGACRNLTPDKLSSTERSSLQECCDRHLKGVLKTLEVDMAVGIGKFAEARLRESLGPDSSVKVVCMPHPSPANPAANGDYDGIALRALRAGGVPI